METKQGHYPFQRAASFEDISRTPQGLVVAMVFSE
jgi:hypothetical protein